MPQPPAPRGQRPGEPDDRNPTLWINLAETQSEFSQYRVTFEVKRADGLRPGKYIAWMKWNADWEKWTGQLRGDQREAWQEKQQQSNAPPKPPADPPADGLPF